MHSAQQGYIPEQDHGVGYAVDHFDHLFNSGERLAGTIVPTPGEDLVTVQYWVEEDVIGEETVQSILDGIDSREDSYFGSELSFSDGFARLEQVPDMENMFVVSISYNRDDYAYGAEEVAESIEKLDPEC